MPKRTNKKKRSILLVIAKILLVLVIVLIILTTFSYIRLTGHLSLNTIKNYSLSDIKEAYSKYENITISELNLSYELKKELISNISLDKLNISDQLKQRLTENISNYSTQIIYNIKQRIINNLSLNELNISDTIKQRIIENLSLASLKKYENSTKQIFSSYSSLTDFLDRGILKNTLLKETINYIVPYKCSKNIECSNWSECKVEYEIYDLLNITQIKGKQSRICEDKNSCTTSMYEEQDCSLKTEIYVKKIISCNNSNINLYDQNNTLMIRITDKRDSASPSLDISLLPSKQDSC